MSNSSTYPSQALEHSAHTRPFLRDLIEALPLYLFATGLRAALTSRR